MYDLAVPGYMSEPELQQIEQWASLVPPGGVIVEVGSFKGRSSVAWAASCDPSVTVYCIDSFRDGLYPEFLKNTEQLTNIQAIVGKSPQVARYENSDIDIFFLDASHSGPAISQHISYYLPKIKKGGLFCGHDYYKNNRYPDIISNVKFLEDLLKQPVTLHSGSLWSFRI